MPGPRWPHLLREVSRHGTVRWVVRKGHGNRIPIEHDYGTPEFADAYHAAIAGEAKPRSKPQVDEKSLRWLAERWQASSAWGETGPAARQKRGALLKRVLETSGDKSYKKVTREGHARPRYRRAREARQDPSAGEQFSGRYASLVQMGGEERFRIRRSDFRRRRSFSPEFQARHSGLDR
jgi:hypothetical protein